MCSLQACSLSLRGGLVAGHYSIVLALDQWQVSQSAEDMGGNTPGHCAFLRAEEDTMTAHRPAANKTYTARRDGEGIGRATRLGVLLSDLEAWARSQ